MCLATQSIQMPQIEKGAETTNNRLEATINQKPKALGKSSDSKLNQSFD